MSPVPRRRTERAPDIEKLIKPALGVALALFAYIFLQGLNSEVCCCYCCCDVGTIVFSNENGHFALLLSELISVRKIR